MIKRIDFGQVIYFIAGLVETILIFRIVFGLVSADPSNNFVRAIFDMSHPLVKPFEGMFNFTGNLDVSAVAAALGYTALAYLLAHLADKWQN